MESKELIKILNQNGWQHVFTRDNHKKFKNPIFENIIIVPDPKKDLGKGLENKTLKQAALHELENRT